MGGVIIFGFIGCIICGWIIGISEKDDRGTRILSYMMAGLMLFLGIMCLFAWKTTIQENVLFEHYNIVQEEITTTTYKIIPNG